MNDEILKQYFRKFGKNVQKLREERNISIAEMSLKTGLKKTYLKKLKRVLHIKFQ